MSEPVGQATAQIIADGLQLDKARLTVLPDKKLLLGTDVLRAERVSTLYCKGQSFIIKEDLIDIVKNLPLGKPRIQLKVKEEVRLEPRTVAMVEMKANDQEEDLIIVDSEPVAGALCEIQDREVILPIANLNTTEMIFEEGRALARGTLVEDENFFELKRKEMAVEQVVVAEEEKIIVEEDINVDDNLPPKHRESLLAM